MCLLCLERQFDITARQRWPDQMATAVKGVLHASGADLGERCRGCTPPPHLRWHVNSSEPSSSLFTLKIFLRSCVIEVISEWNPPPKKNPGSISVPRSSITFPSFVCYRSTQGDLSSQNEGKPRSISAWNKQPMVRLSLIIILQLIQEGVFNSPVPKPTFAKQEATRALSQASKLS